MEEVRLMKGNEALAHAAIRYGTNRYFDYPSIIINTVGTQFHIAFLSSPVASIAGVDYTVGGLAGAVSGPAMAVAIGYALHCPPLVLFSLITVGFASNALGGAGGPQ